MSDQDQEDEREAGRTSPLELQVSEDSPSITVTNHDHGEGSGDLQTPLLSSFSNQQHEASRGVLRQRSTITVDLESGDGGSHSRILDRSRAFRQSRGRWSVRRLSRLPPHGRDCWCCCCGVAGRIWNEWSLGGWFHGLAYQRTGVLMLILMLAYISIVIFFAGIYLSASILGQTTEQNPDGSETNISFCHMDISDKMGALYLSLSTMSSIGYGVSNYYVADCWTPLILTLLQICCAILFDAVAVGLLFHRISRGRKRSRTIAFSDKAVIRKVGGVPHLMFRLGELRRYHLIGATIRCYCVLHERIPIITSSQRRGTTTAVSVETTHFVSRQMKLLYPDEKCGSNVWMGLPQVIVHRMDGESPLVPHPTWYDVDGLAQSYPDLPLDDSRATPQDPLADLSTPMIPKQHHHLQNIGDYLLDRDAEIVVLVEGTDEGTGAVAQARHSYKVTDLAWNHRFLPCIFPFGDDQPDSSRRRPGHPVCSIDFSHFHDIAPAPDDCEVCAYVPQEQKI